MDILRRALRTFFVFLSFSSQNNSHEREPGRVSLIRVRPKFFVLSRILLIGWEYIRIDQHLREIDVSYMFRVTFARLLLSLKKLWGLDVTIFQLVSSNFPKFVLGILQTTLWNVFANGTTKFLKLENSKFTQITTAE